MSLRGRLGCLVLVVHSVNFNPKPSEICMDTNLTIAIPMKQIGLLTEFRHSLYRWNLQLKTHPTCRLQVPQQKVPAWPKVSRSLVSLQEKTENANGAKQPAVGCKFQQEKGPSCSPVGHLARACRNRAKLNQGGKKGFTQEKEAEKQSSHFHSHKVCEAKGESETGRGHLQQKLPWV